MKSWSIRLLSTPYRIAFFVLGLFLIFNVPVSPLLKSELIRAKEHPRFGLAGSDIAALRVSIDDLEKSVYDIADIYGNPEESKSIKTSLHPTSFLKSLVKLEERRREFILYQSFANFLRYRWRMFQTLSFYESDLEKYRGALSSLASSENEVYYFGINAISLGTLLTNADLMLKNAAILKKYSSNFSIKLSDTLLDASSTPPLSSEEQQSADFTRKIVERFGWEIVSPLIELPSDCGNPNDRDLFYLVKRDGFLVPMSINPVYFHFAASRFRTAQFYQPLSEAGFEYAWQPDFNFYFCPDLSYQAEILTLHRTRELLEEWKKSPAPPASDEFEKAADEFLFADPLWRPIQLKLFKAARENDTPVSEEIKLLEIQKSGHFEELVRFGANLNRNFPRFSRRLQEPLELKELFITRSYPSLYFLPFNRSIWIPDIPLGFVDYSEDTELFVSYRKLLDIYSEEELLDLTLLSIGAGRR